MAGCLIAALVGCLQILPANCMFNHCRPKLNLTKLKLEYLCCSNLSIDTSYLIIKDKNTRRKLTLKKSKHILAKPGDLFLVLTLKIDFRFYNIVKQEWKHNDTYKQYNEVFFFK